MNTEFDFQKLANQCGDSAFLYGDYQEAYIDFEEVPEHADIVEYESRVYLDKLAKKLGFQVECVEQHGGEGQGDVIYAVYKVTDPNGSESYYKCSGYYASYHGADYEGCRQVTPKQVTVTRYE